ncbi:hypothetical protein [Komagataeibacter xylinus]|uniref:hypothetical protein n=1 Tax=Komagataeibacter xylinus TaxID=28448 RepID=UPI00102FEAFE|nr:hypothetical protein [Komagataeibacter xylinus]
MYKPDKRRLRTLLEFIADRKSHNGLALTALSDENNGNIPNEVFYDLQYLQNHGYCDIAALHQSPIGERWTWADPVTVTASGTDWISDDGGLTAEKNTITVRFDESTIKLLLKQRLEMTDAPEDEKSKIRQAIEAAPATVLQAAVSEAATSGLAHIPNVLDWLGRLFLG